MKKSFLFIAILSLILPVLVFTDEPAFVTIWDTNKERPYHIHFGGREIRDQITLPLVADGSYDFVVDWGDGIKNNIYRYNDPATTHTYPEPGIYRLKIRGMIAGWSFNNKGHCYKLIEIVQWGPFGFGRGIFRKGPLPVASI